jgi:hypothetical protein
MIFYVVAECRSLEIAARQVEIRSPQRTANPGLPGGVIFGADLIAALFKKGDF